MQRSPVKPTSRAGNKTLGQNLWAFAWYWLRRPKGLLIVGGFFVAIGMIFGWDWIVAIGAAPILLAVAPCAVMCGLGLCMMRSGDKSCGDSKDGTVNGPGLDSKVKGEARSRAELTADSSEPVKRLM